MRFQCPHCQQATFGVKDKLLAGKWVVLHCPSCGRRSCTNPYLLAVLYFFYIWDVVLFGYLAFVKYQVGDPGMAALYAGVMVVGALILEFIAVFIPLLRMTSPPQGNDRQR